MKQIIITIIQKYNQANIFTNSFDMFPVKIQHNPQVIFPFSSCTIVRTWAWTKHIWQYGMHTMTMMFLISQMRNFCLCNITQYNVYFLFTIDACIFLLRRIFPFSSSIYNKTLIWHVYYVILEANKWDSMDVYDQFYVTLKGTIVINDGKEQM